MHSNLVFDFFVDFFYNIEPHFWAEYVFCSDTQRIQARYIHRE